MLRAAHQPAPLRRRWFLSSNAVRAGLLTPGQLRGPAWRRLHRGVYADAGLPLDHGLLTRAAAAALPPDAVVTGVSAAWLWGVRLASSSDPVEVIRPPGRRLRSTRGVRVRNAPLSGAEIDTLSGVRLTTPLRTAWELAVRRDLTEAVAYLDGLARLDRIDGGGLADYLSAMAGRRGCRTATRVFALVDGRAESPQESRLRVMLTLAGLPPATPQYEVHVAGRFVARVDLAWPDLKIAVEYDGVWHAGADQLIRDRRRLNALQAAGWYVHHVTVRDMRDLAATTHAIRRLLERRRPGSGRVE